MRRFVFFAFCCAIALQNMANKNMTFVETLQISKRLSASINKQWNVLEWRPNAEGKISEEKILVYTLASDTIIAEKSYAKMLCSRPGDTDNAEYVAAVREDGTRVYVYYGNEEYLLYNFGAEVGDEMIIFAGLDNAVAGVMTYLNKVIDVLVLPDGRKRISLEIDKGENGMTHTQWIENIGSTRGILYTGGGGLPGGFNYELLCAYAGNECVYTTDDGLFAQYGCTYSRGNEYFVLDQVWSYRITDLCDGDAPTTYIYRMSVSGDTVINQNRYMMLESVPVRENGKQVFAHYNDRDVLIYDFGLQAGDKIASPSGDELATVVATDSVTLLDGRRAKRIQYDRRATDIEYVGSTSDAGVLAPLFGENIPPCGGQQFLCCSVRGETVFETSTGSCGIPETAVQNVTAPLYGMQDGVITLKTPTAQTRLYDMRGCCLLQTTQSSIDISAFSGGMYILHIVFPTGEKAVAKIATR